ncbi:MAG: SDR family oxidoreductase, partial [Myxococcales bacterium]
MEPPHHGADRAAAVGGRRKRLVARDRDARRAARDRPRALLARRDLCRRRRRRHTADGERHPEVTELEKLFGLRGRVAVVTGASAGLGVEFADALASAGASVAVLARRRERVETVAAELAQRHGVDTLAVEADVSDPESSRRAFERIGRDLGGVDILVNNAGLAPTGRAEKQWPEAWRQTIDVNLTGLFHCCLLAAEAMRRGGRGGRIINISSIFGKLGSSLFRVAAYSASKGGVETLTRQLAVEWAADAIT